MLIEGDIIRITDNQTLLAQEVLNVYFYRWDEITIGVTLLDVASRFGSVVVVGVNPLQMPALIHTTVFIENVTNEIDVDELTINSPGQDGSTAEVASSFVAGGIKLAVGSKLTRPGGKRIAGIGEERVSENLWDAPPADLIVATNAIESSLLVTGALIGEGIAVPVIVGRFPITGHLDLSKVQDVTDAIAIGPIRSQVSRRRVVST